MYETIPEALSRTQRDAIESLGDGGRRLVVTDAGWTDPEGDDTWRDIRVLTSDGREVSDAEMQRVIGAVVMLRTLCADVREP